MRKAQLGVLLGCAALTLGLAGLAAASVPTATTVATTQLGGAPRVFIDQEGTVSVLWNAEVAGGYTTLRYARKPAGATRFTQVSLPDVPDLAGDEPFIYEPSPGVLEIIQDVTLKVYAWRSTDDGASWASIDTTALNALYSQGIYIDSSFLTDAPGGPIAFAGSDGSDGAVVQLSSDLSGVATLATNPDGLFGLQVARSGDGATFLLGSSNTTKAVLPFEVGTVTGQVQFPCSGYGAGGLDSHALAAARSVAVVGYEGCGHYWTATITDGGAVGSLVSLGATPKNGGWIALVADRREKLTAAYEVPGGDLQVAHSSDGSHWTVAPGLVPIASAYSYSSDGTLSSGAATLYGSTTETGTTNEGVTNHAVRVIPLSDTYRTPSAPSARGIAHPLRGSLDSLAVTVPGVLALNSFRASGKATVRLVDAIPDTVDVSIDVTRTTRSTVYDLCSGGSSTRLAAEQVRAVTLSCASGAIVIGGGATTGGPDVKKGDLVTFSFTGRNGALTLISKIG